MENNVTIYDASEDESKVKVDASEDLDEQLTRFKDDIEAFLNDTQSARELSERDRDYVDHKQWSEREAAILRARGQAPIVVNRCKPKVQGLKGLVALRNTDPKAYPRTQKHEDAANAITDGLRYVADDNSFNDTVKMEVADDFFVEGYGGAIVDFKKSGKDKDVRIARIPWDRIYFDPHSRNKDYSDSGYMGFQLWLDVKVVLKMFKGLTEDDLCAQADESFDDDTFADKPRWVESNGRRKRVRLAYHFYKEGEEWFMCIFCGSTFCIEPMPSIYLDEYGVPSNPIELVSAYVDRDNNRYGEVRAYIDQQDEINHRRSKALHLMSRRQTKGRKGAVSDIAAMKNELAKADGHVEYEGDPKEFEILQTGDMAKAQFEFYQDSKAELDAVSFNAQLAGDRQNGDLSGVAINKLQQAGTMELNDLFVSLSNWEKRIYRQVWARIKQSWTEEKWIRVTDDQKELKWVGFNVEETVQQFLEDIINDDALAPTDPKKLGAAKQYQLMMQTQDPRLQEVVQVKNAPAEIDVDIILDVSFDTVNVQQEQFELLVKFAGNGSDIDIIELIELSQIRNKKALIEKIEARRKQAAEAQGGAMELATQSTQVDNAKKLEETKKIAAETMQTDLENKLMVSGGQPAKSSMTVSA